MKTTIALPRVGETVDEVYLVAWNKSVGDVIAVGDDLMEVETDKATVQVPSPVAGTLLEIFFKAGDEIKTGDAIAICESKEQLPSQTFSNFHSMAPFLAKEACGIPENWS